MTRFARAKGSKASNERVPEEATPWSEMKKQLLEKNQEGQQQEKKRQADKQRQQNYQAFLNEVEEEKTKNATWAEFPQQPKKKDKKKSAVGEMGAVLIEKKKKVEGDIEEPQKRKRKVKEGTEAEVPVKKKKRDKTPVNNQVNEEPVKVEKMKKKTEKAQDNNEVTNEQPQKKKKGKLKKNRKSLEQEQNTEKEGKSDPETNVKPSDESRPKFQKRSQKPFKLADQKSRKLKDKPVKKAPLTEDDLKKIEKKKQKKVRQVEKRKAFKPKRPDEKPERRKKPQERMIINGKEVEIAYVDGFPIKKEDAERIHQLRKQMISKGLPRSEIKIALKLERRKAEKAFAREKKKVCFNCRKSGHNLSECPDLGKELAESSGTGICFKCGSTEHTHFDCKVVRGQEFKFAQCFICHEQGHIVRQCPDNARGLYPKGGACKVCGDVTHLKKDCPKFQAQQQQLEQSVKLDTMNSDDNPDILERNESVIVKNIKRPNKIIKFSHVFPF